MTEDGGELLTIRCFREQDLPFALERTSEEGWDSTRETFEALLNHDGDGCFVAALGGRPVGMVTTVQYEETGWVGNPIVEPGSRGRGVGAKLMARAVQRLELLGVGTLRLEADPLGIGIYRRLGFVDEYESPRFRLHSAARGSPRDCARLVAEELADLADFDAGAFGDRRDRLLRFLFASALATFRVPESGSLGGYLMIQPSTAGARIGPWVALDRDLAEGLLAAALSFVRGVAVVVAMPGPNADGQELVRSWGFEATTPSLRMVRGPVVAHGIPQQVYALANGAVG
jgi:ribosomal protein S18 acetylase RimI-like enzyme